MNKSIIRNWNSRVKPEDTVFVVGDFCFRNTSDRRGEGIPLPATHWEKQLNGKIIHVRGNHDKNNGVKTIIRNLVIAFGGRVVRLVHKPEHVDFTYPVHFTGHVHEKWKYKRIYEAELYPEERFNSKRYVDCINVGVDQNRFMPISFDEAIKGYNKWRKNGN